jgi:hypothetical protein
MLHLYIWPQGHNTIQAKYDNMRFACWITKAMDTHLFLSHSKCGYANAPEYHVIACVLLSLS